MLILSRLALLVLLLAIAGCGTIKRVGKEKKAADQPQIADANADVSFQGFLNRLRTAAATRDVPTLASMMTPNFGYKLNPPAEGEGVFKYWDENGIWPELELVLREKFAPKDNFMVSPPQFAANPDTYTGYRAGIVNLDGSWRFAYFVNE